MVTRQIGLLCLGLVLAVPGPRLLLPGRQALRGPAPEWPRIRRYPVRLAVAEYLDELSYIDMALAPLLADVAKRGRHLIVITSDHAGHDRLHGTRHPDAYRLPMIIATDTPCDVALPSGTIHLNCAPGPGAGAAAFRHTAGRGLQGGDTGHRIP